MRNEYDTPHEFGDTPPVFGNADQNFPSDVSDICSKGQIVQMLLLAALQKLLDAERRSKGW
jgi:hypothetical protein